MPQITSMMSKLRLERDIAPPQRLSVTIPLLVDGKRDRFHIYVSVNTWALDCIPTAQELMVVADHVNRLLGAKNG